MKATVKRRANTYMKFILVLLFGLQAACFNDPPPGPGDIYLCMGSRSYAYHLYKDCQAFDKCTTRVYTVTLKEAVRDKRRTLCTWCKKRNKN